MNAETKENLCFSVQSRGGPRGRSGMLARGVRAALLRAFASAPAWLVRRSWPCKRQEKALWDVKPGTHDENSPQAARKVVSRSEKEGRRRPVGESLAEAPGEQASENRGQLLRRVRESEVDVAPWSCVHTPTPQPMSDLLGKSSVQGVMKLRVFRWNDPGLTLNPTACARTNVRQREIRDTQRRRRCEGGDVVGVMWPQARGGLEAQKLV